jgi:surface antigen
MRGNRILAMVLAALSGLVLAACSTARTLPTPSESDFAVLARVTQDALEANATGTANNWANPETGARGTVTPMRTFKDGGTPCRDYQQTFTAGSRTMLAYATACRGGDGTWNTREHTGFYDPERRRYVRDGYYHYPYWPYYRRYPYGWYWYDDPFWPSRRSFFWMGYGRDF